MTDKPYICPRCPNFSCTDCRDYLVRVWMAEEKVPFALVADAAPPMVETYALTDSHVAALEDAIRAEGYDILYDTETGKIRLVKVSDADRPAPGQPHGDVADPE